MKKIGFVIPWYHKDIRGGAELELKGIVTQLHKRGVDLEILTTCVKEFSADWTENYFKEGVEIVEGIPVRRFKVRKGNMKEFHAINARLMRGESISIDEEQTFLHEMVNSQDLYDYIKNHSEEYHKFVYIPYMFGPTYYGIKACPFKSVLISCLHEECYAYFRSFRDAYANMAGIIYLSKPEQEIARRLWKLSKVKETVMGAGVDTEFEYDADRFRKKYNIDYPYILYAGRKDEGKNIYTLIKYFCEYKKRNPNRDKLKLIMIGGGDVTVPEEFKDDIIDMGFLDMQDKFDAYAGAELLCQPSLHESFSLVIMESWLCERPVLVHEGCAVTTNFARESNAGLYFRDYFQFEGCVDYILDNESTAHQMGLNGRKYVLDNFTWDIVIDKFMKAIG